jgi:hypothetical protein
MNVEVVFIPDLLRHLARGWSEDQLISGRVATLGRTSLSLQLATDATLLMLARAVEDAWGVAVADQAYRWRANSLAPRDAETAARRLVDLGMPLPPARAARVLMSAGAPAGTARAAGAQGGTATALRSPTTVEVITQEEADAESAAEGPAQAAPPAVTPFSGASNTLAGAHAASTSASAAEELTPAQRRERAAAAAAARAAAAQDA